MLNRITRTMDFGAPNMGYFYSLCSLARNTRNRLDLLSVEQTTSLVMLLSHCGKSLLDGHSLALTQCNAAKCAVNASLRTADP